MWKNPDDLDGFLPLVRTTDMKLKISIGEKLLNYLSNDSNPTICSDIGQLIESITSWLGTSNYKVALISLDILKKFSLRMKEDLGVYFGILCVAVMEKLGDTKTNVRDNALDLLATILREKVVPAQQMFDKITPIGFNHKNPFVRENTLLLWNLFIEENGIHGIFISRTIPFMGKLLNDSSAGVRSVAFKFCVQVYKLVGERYRDDLKRNGGISDQKFVELRETFDNIKPKGAELWKNGEDQVDRIMPNLNTHRSTPNTSVIKKKTTLEMQKSGKGSAITTFDEKTFSETFEHVGHMEIHSAKDVDEALKLFQSVITRSERSDDWNMRVDSLKKLQILVKSYYRHKDILLIEDFPSKVNALVPCLRSCLKDLRSQVVRETAVTISFISSMMREDFSYICVSIWDDLITLVGNSTSVFALSGQWTMRFIVNYTHSPRLLPVICAKLTSRCKEIRRFTCELVVIILEKWPKGAHEKHAKIIQDIIKRGIEDADPEARAHARKAYKMFNDIYPHLGAALLTSLDRHQARMVSLDVSKLTGTLSNMTITRSTSEINSQAAKYARNRAYFPSTTLASGNRSGRKINNSSRGVVQKALPWKGDANGGGGKNAYHSQRLSSSTPTSRMGSPLPPANIFCGGVDTFLKPRDVNFTRPDLKKLMQPKPVDNLSKLISSKDDGKMNPNKNGGYLSDESVGVVGEDWFTSIMPQLLLTDLSHEVDQPPVRLPVSNLLQNINMAVFKLENYLNKFDELLNEEANIKWVNDLTILIKRVDHVDVSKNFKKLGLNLLRLLNMNVVDISSCVLWALSYLANMSILWVQFEETMEMFLIRTITICRDPRLIWIGEKSAILLARINPTKALSAITALIDLENYPANLAAVDTVGNILRLFPEAGEPQYVSFAMKSLVRRFHDEYENRRTAERAVIVISDLQSKIPPKCFMEYIYRAGKSGKELYKRICDMHADKLARGLPIVFNENVDSSLSLEAQFSQSRSINAVKMSYMVSQIEDIIQQDGDRVLESLEEFKNYVLQVDDDSLEPHIVDLMRLLAMEFGTKSHIRQENSLRILNNLTTRPRFHKELKGRLDLFLASCVKLARTESLIALVEQVAISLSNLDPSGAVAVVAPLMSVEEFPANLAATNVLNAIIQSHPNVIKQDVKDFLMKEWTKLFDSDITRLRKAACLALISMRDVMPPEQLQQFMAELPGPKVKVMEMFMNKI